MKQILSLLIVLNALSLQARPSKSAGTKKKVAFKAVIDLKDGTVWRGWLYQAEPDQIILKALKPNAENLYTLAPEQIERIKLYRKARIGRGLIFGKSNDPSLSHSLPHYLI